MARRTREILLVEDNPADQALCREAFGELGREIELSVASSGSEALQLLTTRSQQGAALPDLVLLDIHLPGLSGLGVLSRLRAEPALSLLPVLMLSTSQHPGDVQEAYRLRANGYLVKPFNYDELRELMGRTVAFWLDSALLPTSMAATS